MLHLEQKLSHRCRFKLCGAALPAPLQFRQPKGKWDPWGFLLIIRRRPKNWETQVHPLKESELTYHRRCFVFLSTNVSEPLHT